MEIKKDKDSRGSYYYAVVEHPLLPSYSNRFCVTGRTESAVKEKVKKLLESWEKLKNT